MLPSYNELCLTYTKCGRECFFSILKGVLPSCIWYVFLFRYGGWVGRVDHEHKENILSRKNVGNYGQPVSGLVYNGVRLVRSSVCVCVLTCQLFNED